MKKNKTTLDVFDVVCVGSIPKGVYANSWIRAFKKCDEETRNLWLERTKQWFEVKEARVKYFNSLPKREQEVLTELLSACFYVADEKKKEEKQKEEDYILAWG